MPYLNPVFTLALSLFLFVDGSTAVADLIVYDSFESFLAGTTKLSFESFESFDDTALSSSPIVANDFTVNPLSASAQVKSGSAGGRFPTNGVKFVESHSPTESIELSFDLKEPATAFGLSVTDFGDFGTGSLTFQTDNGELAQQFIAADTPRMDSNLVFFGFAQRTPFTNLTLRTGNPGDAIGIDSVYVGEAIPEPAAFWGVSVIACLAMLGRFRA